ncbi:CRISPR type III-A-associated RAMP protein Csm5 [Phorcysia thermohydrogeniphila]|uniref:CRISPR system Cms protein Csm5 n=2 Tax=Phorcysia thermohydrogeniphila TaxID=936138 RepID=A0A4R1GP48_9BACT|nr:CRISPR type III-A-associated RAMP protein Csm5 [Phorcysia thermohydrogeniphila]
MAPVTFRCRLEVKTPLSITTGEEYTFLEYTVKGNKFYLIDFGRFIGKLRKAGKFREFFELMKNFTVYDIPRLQRFFMENVDESVSLFVGEVDEDAVKYFRNKMRSMQRLSREDKETFQKTVSKFVVKKIHRNPLTNLPYIPGSSIKGAIRTALINYLLEEGCIDREKVFGEIEEAFRKYLKDTWPKSYSKDELKGKRKAVDKLMEELSKVFSGELDSSLRCDVTKYEKFFENNDFSKDFFRFVKVSDFRPISDVVTSIGRIRRLKRKGGESKFGLMEYIKEGAFEGEVTIYPSYMKAFLSFPLELTPSLLIKALRKEFSKVFNKEHKLWKVSAFKVSPAFSEYYRSEEGKNKVSFVKLGFGAGALSKTFSDDDIRVVGNAVTGIRNVPTELTLLGGKPLGWCVLEVVE